MNSWDERLWWSELEISWRAQLFEHLVPSWWQSLMRLWRSGLVEGSMSLEADFEDLKTLTIFSKLSVSCLRFKMWALGFCSRCLPYLPPQACCTLILWNHKTLPSVSCFWTWFCITGTEALPRTQTHHGNVYLTWLMRKGPVSENVPKTRSWETTISLQSTW